MYELPTSVEIDNVEWKIRNQGDYRMVLDIFSILEDAELTQSERIACALIVFFDGMNGIEDLAKISDMETAVHKMYDFFNAGRKEGHSVNRKLIDWEDDSAMIVSAINNVAGKEIRSESYLHWWTFVSYYMAIGESTMSTVVSIRDKILKGQGLEKWERKFRSENSQYFIWNHKTVEEVEAENWVMNIWNADKG